MFWETQLWVGVPKGPGLWEDVLFQNITPLQNSEGPAEMLGTRGRDR